MAKKPAAEEEVSQTTAANSADMPDYLKGGNVNMGDVDSAAASSLSVPRISLKGKMFRLIENGEEVDKVKERLNVTIVGVEPEAGANIKTFYANGYTPNSNEPPTCSSENGINPAPWVLQQNRQSNHCQTCPKNVFGSAKSPTGKATKACRDSKRIWVKVASDPADFKQRVTYGLNITVSSLRAFADYGRLLKSMGAPMHAAITSLVMDEEAEYPQLTFEVAGWLAQSEFLISQDLNTQRPWRLHVAAPAMDALENNSSQRTQLPGMAPPDYVKVNQQAQDAAAKDQEDGVVEGTARIVDDKGGKTGNSEDILNNW